MSDLVSRVYKPDPQWCCEACVFGRGQHSAGCPKGGPTQDFQPITGRGGCMEGRTEALAAGSLFWPCDEPATSVCITCGNHQCTDHAAACLEQGHRVEVIVDPEESAESYEASATLLER